MKNILLVLILSYTQFSFSQDTMILFFTDKPTVEMSEIQLFSPRAIERRKKKSIILNEYDLPVHSSYLNQLSNDGDILKASKWLNAIVYSTILTSDDLQLKYSFIERVVIVNKTAKSTIKKNFSNQEKSIDYGAATYQNEQINVDCLHDQGYTGNGIYLAVIDAGFDNMDSVSYFDSLYMNNRVIDSYDFVLNQTDVYANSEHGTMVSSCIVGEKNVGQPKYVGSAKDVDIALYRSENVYSETLIEEFDLVRALERCDSVGVDIANISLGYVGFDDSTTSHVYADLDGNTTIASQGVNVAISKGIAVVIAAGNGGPNYISTPCDADDGLCVGAVNEFGDYAFFSSVGPNADGQVKPDVAARGENAYVVTPADMIISGNGTSFASPIMCGATACLMEANPTKSVQEIFDAIRMSASQYAFPDSLRGYGIPDFCVANDIINSGVGLAENNLNELLLYPNPSKNELTVYGFEKNQTVSFVIYNSLGEIVLKGNETTNEGFFKLNVSSISTGNYILEVDSNGIIIAKEQLVIVD